MEGAAVVHAARRLGIAGGEVRVISNSTGDRERQRWDMARAMAALHALGARLEDAARG
jgi:nucleoside phosphorylase